VRLVDTWLTVLLTVNRYIAVCHPLKIHSRCGTARTWTIIAVVVAVSVLFSMPRCFEFKLVNDEFLSYKFIPTALNTTALTHNQVYVIVYRTSLFFVFPRISNALTKLLADSSLFFVFPRISNALTKLLAGSSLFIVFPRISNALTKLLADTSLFFVFPRISKALTKLLADSSLFFVFPRISNALTKLLADSSLFFVVMYLAPMSLMMILNGLLLRALRRSQRSRVTTLCHLLTVNLTFHDMTLV